MPTPPAGTLQQDFSDLQVKVAESKSMVELDTGLEATPLLAEGKEDKLGSDPAHPKNEKDG